MRAMQLEIDIDPNKNGQKKRGFEMNIFLPFQCRTSFIGILGNILGIILLIMFAKLLFFLLMISSRVIITSKLQFIAVLGHGFLE